MVDLPLRAIGGATCLLGVLVAAITARTGLRAPSRRTRFISEILAAWRRDGDDGRTGWGWWGSALANLLLGGGAVMFALDALERGGLERVASLVTGLALLAVVAVPLHFLAHPRDARWRDFGHPIAAATFYLAALVLGACRLGSTGPIGVALSIIHVASSCSLIALSIYTSCQELPPCVTLWPPIGTPILLDLRPDSRARWVRWFQWPATLAVGIALSAGAFGY